MRWVPFLSPRSLLAVSSASSPSSNEKKCPLPSSNFHKVRRYLGELSESCPRCGWPVSVLYRHEPPGSPLSGSSFLGPGTFPDSFPPTTPSTPTLAEFTPGPPPVSYQSDIPSSLLTPERSAPCLPGQVSAKAGG